MVFCIVALVVFGIMGIFSASHRTLAKEAFACVFRMATLRKCETGFDQKMKMKISVGLVKHSPKASNFVYKHFNAISWVLVILTVLSLFGIGLGLYNLAVFGDCNGEHPTEACLFKPETYDKGFDFFGIKFFEKQHTPLDITPIIVGNAPSIGDPNAKVKIVEVGCFTCPFTKLAETDVNQILTEFDGDVYFSFKYFPLPTHNYSFEAAVSAECAREQGKFWEYKEKLFEFQSACSSSANTTELNTKFGSIAKELSLDTAQFESCINSQKYVGVVEEHKSQDISAGIYATPTFYVNGKVLVAPTYDELREAVRIALDLS